MNKKSDLKRILIALAASLLTLVALPSFAAQKYDAKISGVMAKVAIEKSRETPSAASGLRAQDELVNILVRFNDANALDGIRSAGGAVNSVLGNIATVRVPASALEALVSMDEIHYMEAEKQVPQRLTSSVAATRANLLRTGVSPNLTGATGAGVIVGIVDDGVDFRHLSFRNTNGTTRLLALWDQRVTGAAGSPPTGFNYGGECTPALLDAAITGGAGCTQPSTGNHGTHVAGIAAGNGQQTGNGQAAYRFVGMAPQADILAANSIAGGTGGSNSVVDAISWMKSKAAAAGKPLVINLSLGSYFGARDGTSNYEQALSNAGAAGVIITSAAGNEGSDKIVATGQISAGQTRAVTFSWANSVNKDQKIEIWYPGVNQYAIKLTGPNGCAMPDFVLAGNTNTFTLPCGTIDVTSTAPQTNNDDRQILVNFTINPANPNGFKGNWTYEVRGDSVAAANTSFTMICGEDSGGLVFTSNTPSGFTLGILTDTSTPTRTISVASYNTSSSWLTTGGVPNTPANYNHGPITDVSTFSSRGPRRNCSNATKCPPVMKPEITAPGAMIMSSLGQDAKAPDNPETVESDGKHVAYNGTSMAAPHAAGAIALMLQKNPTLTPEQVKQILFQTVQTNAFTTALPTYNPATPLLPAVTNNNWGYGILDAQAAYNAVQAVVVADPGVLQLTASTLSVGEAGGSAVVSVSRTGGSSGVATVNYVTTGITATAGSDFTAQAGTLTWAAGDSAAKTITVPIINDTLIEGNETFSITLSAAVGATLGTPATVTVTIVDDDVPSVPGAPTIGTGTGGSGVAVIAFTAPANTGGNPIIDYTATCTGTPNAAATGISSPITVSGLTNGNVYSCSVVARNTLGSSVASAVVSVTPSQTPVPPVFTSAASAAFTVGAAGTFNVTATGFPVPTFASASSLPGGVTFTAAGVLAGTPTAAGVFPLSIVATGANPAATQNFTLTVNKGNLAINFAAITAKAFNTSPLALSATTTPTLAGVAFDSTTPSVCTVLAANVTFVTTGTCTIVASHAGDANYNAAASVTQSFAITPVAPGAPTGLTANPGNLQAVFSFTAPATTGGGAIIDYTVICTGGAGGTATGTASPLTVIGLTNGTVYSCSVVARNAVGSSAASAVVAVTPSPTPVPPAFTSAASVTFTFAVAGTFNVTATGFPVPTFATASTMPGGVTLTAAGVLAGTPTAAGVFPLSIVATGATPAATQSFTLTVNKANLAINFAAITAKAFNTSPLALTATTTPLLAGVAFASTTPNVCTVFTTNVTFVAAGSCSIVASHAGNTNYNAATSVTQSFTITPVAPGVPTGLAATAGNQQAVFAFAAPLDTGGSAIIDYTLICTGGAGGTVTGALSPLTLSGLVNGTAYTCTVSARGAGGTGAASATVSVTPVPIVPPGAPIIGGATAGNAQATIQFSAPLTNGGSAITGYTATCNPGGIAASSPASPIVVSGLANGTSYSCSVRATNVAGTGIASDSVLVTPANVPIILASSSNPAAFGAPVTLTAIVNGNAPTGTVAFSVSADSGSVVLPGCAAVPLAGGTASCNVAGSFQTVNPRFYQASYSGNATNPPASISLTQNVNLNMAVLSVAAYPLPPVVAGRTVTLSALVKMSNPVGTITVFDNGVAVSGCAQLPIAIVADTTDSGVANCVLTPATSPSGSKVYVVSYFYPAGHVSGRVFEQTTVSLRVNATGPVDYTDMWWAGAAENGWGISINQHGSIQFNVIFAYDSAGKSLWYVMPNGSFNAAGNVVTGALYLPTSSPFSAYDASKFVVGAPVGSATITYSGNSTATLAYTINGVSATKSIQRQLFAPETTLANLRTNDIWWATAAEDGWGINIAQQGRVLFPVWYTYDAAGKATFFTAQNGSWRGTVWSGTVLSHTSSAWLGVPYVASAFTATTVGTMSLDFRDASNATMTYTVNGVTQSKRIERVVY